MTLLPDQPAQPGDRRAMSEALSSMLDQVAREIVRRLRQAQDQAANQRLEEDNVHEE